jgi:hypothetical protein
VTIHEISGLEKPGVEESGLQDLNKYLPCGEKRLTEKSSVCKKKDYEPRSYPHSRSPSGKAALENPAEKELACIRQGTQKAGKTGY